MSAPSADFPALSASTSSSGYTDGLGRRSLAFDREDGTMLERLVVRAELSAFERSLRERVERIAALDDERLARPRSIERAHDGSLVVLSEFVPGNRLSDVLDATAQNGTVPGVDVAIGYLLDVLPALCGLHAGAGFAHGAISPGRTVLTPAGQVVLLDAIFGDALSHLQYSRRRLWSEFAIAMPPSAGRPRFDAAADIAQAVLSAVMLVFGRPVRDYEYPEGIASLLVEVVDIAQIRATTEFATALQRFLQRSLPIAGRRPYTAADDALIDLRDLARTIGIDVCRRALADFIEQMESGGEHAAADSDRSAAEYGYDFGGDETFDADASADTEDGDGIELDLDLDERTAADEDTIYDLSEGTDEEQPETPVVEPEPETDTAAALPELAAEPIEAESPAITFDPLPEPGPVPFDDAFAATRFTEKSKPESAAIEPLAEAAPVEPVPEEFESCATAATEAAEAETETETSDYAALDEISIEEPSEPDTPAVEPETPEESNASRRRKRARSARSRKDKLRSTARPEPLRPVAPPPPPPPPKPAPPAKPSHGGWMIEPGRAAAFEPPVPTVTPAPPPVPVFTPPPPPPIVTAPLPPVPQPIAPVSIRPIVPAPVAEPLPQPTAPRLAVSPAIPVAPAPLKLKADTPGGFAPPRKPKAEPIENPFAARAMAPPPVQEPSAFPWKLASAALVLMVIAVLVGRSYLPNRSEPDRKADAAATIAPPSTAGPSAPVTASKMGRIQIESKPPARVLIDGKQVGESPMSIEVPAGKHTVTLASAVGSVRQPVQVVAGKTVVVNLPIYDGWLDVVSPIILDVVDNGKSIGNTEEHRLLLQPGPHELILSNRDLDYSSKHSIDIKPGDVKTLTLDPRGILNLNATPWAEVWIDGKKVGETPIANLSYPLGTHELVFKYPQYPDQRRTITLRAGAPEAISVDMRKQ